ncbi:AAA family ATPase [Loktanella agnita]|uniref:AAA family ATPase n=1 Tax=Loktanella agnita TaxID=287097 RepID=UPI0039890D18
MRRGFVLGKFMPFHAGHQFLCDVASNLVDELTVLVCTRDCEPIDGQRRFDWVSQSVRRNVRVVHLHRDIPQEPAEHPDFWTIWKAVIAEYHPKPIDTVFGSETYVTKLAETLDAAPFIVDLPRDSVPISARQIRANPAAHWDFIPPAVRPDYQTRICLLGPESTGKTTLANALGYPVIPEYGRSYDAQFRQGQNWTAADFIALSQGHIALRREIAARSGPVCIEDTDLIQTMAWADFLLGKIPEPLLDIAAGWTAATHYILLTPDVPWTNDGTRYTGDSAARTRFLECLITLLNRYDLRYDVITGADWAARTQSASKLVADISRHQP